MARPIVIAHHLVWTIYGVWLPNDPRGSSSHRVASDVIAELGELHFGRKQVQPAGWAVRDFQQKAAEVLRFGVLSLGLPEIDIIAAAIDESISTEKYTCYACAIMPDHVHILVRKHKHEAEQMIATFQQSSRLRLRNAYPKMTTHPIWGGPGWKVFLDHPDDIRRTITYIERNPIQWRLPRQDWPFVKPYDGWPLHPGHSPNSPYARRLREHYK